MSNDPWRTEPLYTISEAAHLAGVHAQTVRRWMFGYKPSRREPSRPAVLGAKEATSPYVSFLELIEVVIAAKFRKVSHVKLDVVRRAYVRASSTWNLEHPFAHLKLESLGGHVIQWMRADDESTTIAHVVDKPEQIALPGLVTEQIHALDYELDLAARWYPVGKDIPIVVDPRFSTGQPTLIDRGVTIGAIYRRWKADQPISFIADDLKIDTNLVERALRYADKVAA